MKSTFSHHSMGPINLQIFIYNHDIMGLISFGIARKMLFYLSNRIFSHEKIVHKQKSVGILSLHKHQKLYI